jgi:hypothetical protein
MFDVRGLSLANAGLKPNQITTNVKRQTSNLVNIIPFPARTEWPRLLARPMQDSAQIEAIVAPILQQVRNQGDAALIDLTAKFDKIDLSAGFEVSTADLDAAESQLSHDLKAAIRQAYQNIRTFHEAQRQPIQKIETMPGVTCWRRSVGIERVGIYVPGGTAPLFSTVLMLGRLPRCGAVFARQSPRHLFRGQTRGRNAGVSAWRGAGNSGHDLRHRNRPESL